MFRGLAVVVTVAALVSWPARRRRPVLLRFAYGSGHGLLAVSRAQRIALLTDEFSFLLWQCGSPQFSGIPTTIQPAQL